MTVRVVYAPRAVEQLEALYRYIADNSGPIRAEYFISRIMEYCDGLDTFPHRGARRDDIRPGLRTVGFRRRVTVAFTAEEDTVTILGVFYGGQDFEALLRDGDKR